SVAAGMAPPVPGGGEPGGAIDYAAVLARVGGETQLLVDVIRLFIDGVSAHLREIRTALDQRDGDALRRAAHAYKGAAANFEAEAVVSTARRLEEIGRDARFDEGDEAWQTLTDETSDIVATLRTFAARHTLKAS